MTIDERPWLASYPKSIPAQIDPSQYRSVAALLEECCDRFRHRPAFTNMGKQITYDQLDKLTRVWTIGNGIGYGRWPYVEGVWEGGHITVTLDPKERFCGCGGVGHLEGIMGYRAMRLRFLDREPEEIFAHAKEGDHKCREFVDLWHRALAAGTASFIHLAGPGRFYFTGHNVHFLDVQLLRAYIESMVKMSPLQSFSLEVLPPEDETALLGAGVSALRALTW